MMVGRRWGLGGLLAVAMLIGCAAMPPKDEDGRTGVFTLHEGGGERVLTYDGGGTVGSAKWERAW
jgi:hypothetical protein